jgi:hypothetical protein
VGQSTDHSKRTGKRVSKALPTAKSSQRSSTVVLVPSASLKLIRSTSNPSGSLFHRAAPGGVIVGLKAHTARTRLPGETAKLASVHA